MSITDDLAVDGVSNLDVTNVVGALTVGVNDTGHDVKFYGATASSYMLWDESEDRLEIAIGTQDGTAIQINTSDNRTKDIVWDEGGTTKGMIRYHNDSSGTDANDRMEIGTATDLDNLVIKDGNVGVATTSFQAAAVAQLAIANGTSPGAHTDNQIYIGAKNSAGTGTDTSGSVTSSVASGSTSGGTGGSGGSGSSY